jgi:hypothetical protein
LYADRILPNMPDPMLQTRVPAAVFQRVQAAAEEHSDTVAGWLRRLVIRQTRMNRIAAWLRHHRHADPAVHFSPDNHGAPTYFLEPVRDYSALERTFLLFGPDGYIPLPFEDWRNTPAFMRQSEHVFLLDGSANVWRIVTVLSESTTGLIELSLSAEPTSQSFRSYSEANARYRQLGAAFSRTKGARGQERATLGLGSVQVSLHVDEADPTEMVLPRLVAMLERGLGLQ